MNKFLDICNQPKLNQEDINHQNNPIMCDEIESVIKSIRTKKTPGPDGFMANFKQTFKEELSPIVLKFFQKTEWKGTLPNSSIKPALHSFQNPVTM
jgi:hypothetical protein